MEQGESAQCEGGGRSGVDQRLDKERRRRERRERRARRQQRSCQLVSQMDGYMYEGGCVPDLLHQHLPPPAYTTLPGRNRRDDRRDDRREGQAWRPRVPSFPGRSRGCTEDGGLHVQTLIQNETESKSCCGLAASQTVSIRWFIVMIAFVGICCSVVGTVLGAMKASGREHLTVSLLMIGVGIVLITVSGIAWRLTSQDAPSCRAMLGLGTEEVDGRFLAPHMVPRTNQHPYAGMMYSDFQYRPPPPSYQASMQEYRLRLLLGDRPQPPPPPALSPPPAYRGPTCYPAMAPLHGSVSRPPSYRSRAPSSILPLHGRHPSQLSYLSYAGAPSEPLHEEETSKQCPVHVTQVPVMGSNTHKASIRIHGTTDMEQYITNIQEQFDRLENINKGEKSKRQRKESEVTIVQNTSMEVHHPVVVTVSGSLDLAESNSNAEQDILAHL